jgi:hypothetical protein
MLSLYGNPIRSKTVWEMWLEEQDRPNTMERVLLKTSSLPTQYGLVWPPPRSPDCWHTAILKERETWYAEHGIGKEL